MKILICLFWVLPALAAESYSISFKREPVTIKRASVVVSDNSVKPGDEITVGAKGLLVLKGGGESLKILENTTLSPRVTKNTPVIHLKKGSVVSQVKGTPFRVRTPMASFGVRGTSFFVHTAGGDDAWMCVQEGVVLAATNKGKATSVPAGKGVFVKGKTVSTPRPFAWTRDINWNQDPAQGNMDFTPKLDGVYDLKGEFYD